MLATFGWLGALVWAAKAISAARGMRRVVNLLGPTFNGQVPGAPHLVVIVPACNEEANVAGCVRSLLAQDYGDLHLIAVDDRSTDGTGAILDGIAVESPGRLTVLHVTELPAGWLGKTHAMAFAARHAQAMHHPDWLLFTDGDIFFHPEALRRSLVAAERERADHFVMLPTPILQSSREAFLLGFLQVLGLWGVRPWKVADPRARDAIGVGAFNMIRAASYQQIGGFDALRMQILDDLSLARRVKDAGLRQRVAVAPDYVRVHWAAGVRGIVNTMTKNLFAVFEFRIVLLLGSCAGVLLVFLAPCAALFWQPARVPAAIALVAMLAMYVTMSGTSGIPAWTFLGFPASAAVFVYALLKSSVTTLLQGGVIWRGAFYPLRELRKQSSRLW